ncbi:MAG: hypothetical protein ACYC3G_03320 [Minisyncoccota bacterium]
MILSLHSITGAVLASDSNSIGQAILLGIVSHYFLDSIPHVEYKIDNIQKGELKLAIKEFSKIFIDLIIGLIVILYIIKDSTIDRSILVLTGSFFAILPDGLYFIDCLIKNKNKNIFTKFLNIHSVFHRKIHSTISNKFITIPSQIIIVLFLIFLILK